ncbi:MAG: HAD hydrolase family protein [Oscillospiraceae bacterium]|nr:HAD hydrolase family protein [Oscillospiraceae bacterium]
MSLFSRKSISTSGICRAAEHPHIDISDIAAFGDNFGDMDILQGCERGVAMGNAISEVKAISDPICGTCDEDGIAKCLE